MNVALVLMIKNENNYIKEYIEYYKSLGIDTIYLCDNNDIDGETPEDVIKEYIDSGFVQYKNIRGINEYQLQCYNTMYNELSSKFDWIAFLDADEFLVLKKHSNIKSWLSQTKFQHTDQILIEMVNYGDNDLLKVENNFSVLQRFTKSCNECGLTPLTHPYTIDNGNALINADYVIRSIIKGKLKNIEFKCNQCVYDIKTVNTLGEIVLPRAHQLPCNGDAIIKHYNTKTLDEFLKRCENDVRYANNLSFINSKLISFFTKSTYTIEKYHMIQDKYPWFSYRPDLKDSPIDVVVKWIDENTLKQVESIHTYMPWVRTIYIIMNKKQNILPLFDNVKIVEYIEFVPRKILNINEQLAEIFIWGIKNISEKIIYFDKPCIINFPCFEDEFFMDGKINIHMSNLENIPDNDKPKCYNNTLITMELLSMNLKNFSSKKFYVYPMGFTPLIKSDCKACLQYIKNHYREKIIKLFSKNINFYVFSFWSHVMKHSYSGALLCDLEYYKYSNIIDGLPKYKISIREIQKNYPYDVALCGGTLNNNYGATLTYYALYHYLVSNGYKTIIIPPCENQDRGGMDKGNVFDKYCNISENYFEQNMFKYNDLTDTFLVGSDQIWNGNLRHGLHSYLDYVYDDKNKIAYSVCYGNTTDFHSKLGSKYDIVKTLIGRFNHISHRVLENCNITAEQFNKYADHTIDPVFLVDKSVYENLISESIVDTGDDYICFYNLWGSQDVYDKVHKIINNINCREIVIGNGIKKSFNKQKKKHPNEKYVNPILAQDWLKYIKYSKLVITDSFHAVCFSIILNKPFLYIGSMSDTRLNWLLSSTGLEENCVSPNDLSYKNVIKLMNKQIGDEYIHKLDPLISYSKKWLKNVLQQ